jgi:uncharacterized protein with PIN domain
MRGPQKRSSDTTPRDCRHDHRRRHVSHHRGAFGRGRHPAALNFVDCLSYALAKSLGAPLLFKGNDFTRTDIASVL